VACDADGRCLDVDGEPITEPGGMKTGGASGTGAGGAGASGGGGNGVGGASGGASAGCGICSVPACAPGQVPEQGPDDCCPSCGLVGGTAGTGGSDGSLVCQGVDCGPGSHCCADCDGHQCVPDGSECPDLFCPGSACSLEGDPCCDPFPGDGPNYCGAGLTCCGNNLCASACEGGAPDLTGDIECGSETCGTGQVCARPCCGGSPEPTPCKPPPPFCVDHAEACTGDFCSTMGCTGDLDGRDILCTCA
jgi:hypothetical protein